jgi:hypothetical protein
MKSQYVDKLLNKLNAEFEAEQIPVILENYSVALSCYSNVKKKIGKDGGSIHYGWHLHDNGAIYEAEHHAVWENDNGQLIDITPNKHNKSEISFVSDNHFADNGNSIDNVRINITNMLCVDDFILISEQIQKLYSLGNRIANDKITIAPEVSKIITSYQLWVGQVGNFIKTKPTEFTKCFCNSNKSYKNCHHKDLMESLNRDFIKAKNYAKSAPK